MLKLHGVVEYRFIAPGDTQEGDLVIKDEKKMEVIAKYLQESAASYKRAGYAQEVIELTEGRTRTTERTVLVRRPVK